MQQIEVIISLHPRADADVVRKLTEQFNFKIDDMPVENYYHVQICWYDFSTVIFMQLHVVFLFCVSMPTIFHMVFDE